MKSDGDRVATGLDDVDAEATLRAMQNAALERALTSPVDADDYVAFAGALERSRQSVSSSTSLPGSALLACLVGFRLTTGDGDASLTSPSTVRADPDDAPNATLDAASTSRQALRLTGAMLALSRFDISTSRAAALANRSVGDFETELARRTDE